jgi:transposase
VPNKGYRVLRADEHRRFAVSKQSRAERQMKKALRALMHARLDEMSEEGRTLHQQQTMITSATLAAFQYHEERLNRIEALLRGTTTLNPDDPDRSK